MRETRFIGQHAGKWKEFEQAIQEKLDDPDRMDELTNRVLDDLSYARTFFPNRSVRIYLNDLAKRIFLLVVKKQKPPFSKIKHFWLTDLPLLLFQARRDMLIAFLVFWGAFAIGVLSSRIDSSFPAQILGDSYVEMTNQFIEEGDPMAVYKQEEPFGMAIGIALNNLYVSLLAFSMGILYALGSLLILMYNGIMVGAFQYFFMEQGLFKESFLTIWIHGTLEISAIILAGGAGITMGRGLIFPGTYTRSQAFRRSARRGLTILLGIAPVLILAAFFEGFLTRFTDTPDSIRGVFIFVCLAFVLLYFVWYPRKIFRDKGIDSLSIPEQPLLTTQIPPDLYLIRNTTALIADSFYFIKDSFAAILRAALLAATTYSVLLLAFQSEVALHFQQPEKLLGSLISLAQLYPDPFTHWATWLHIPLFASFYSVITQRLYHPGSYRMIAILKNLLPAAVLILGASTDNDPIRFFILLSVPGLLFWMTLVALEPEVRWLGLPKTFRMLKRNSGRVTALFMVVTGTVVFLFTLLDSGVGAWFFSFFSWFIQLPEAQMESFTSYLFLLITIFFQYQGIAVIAGGMGLCYFTLREIVEAPGLLSRIQEVGGKKQIRGLERES